MPFKSRMWGLGWGLLDRHEARPRAWAAAKRERSSLTASMWATGMFSIPGSTPRAKTVYLLQVAAEIEHALMVQYLYAAYSIDETFDRGVNDDRCRTVNEWKRDIRGIARQEMSHLVTVQNLLIALGAEPDLSRENAFQDHPHEYPFPMMFERLSPHSLAKYVATESPDPGEMSVPGEATALRRVLRTVEKDLRTNVNRVGVIYATLYWLFLASDSAEGPWALPASARRCFRSAGLAGVHVRDDDFVSSDQYLEFAATPDEWEVFEPAMHVDGVDSRRRALAAVHWITSQGEGPVGKPPAARATATSLDERSHFQKFLSMYQAFKKDEPHLSRAVMRVPTNPMTPRRSAPRPQGVKAVITHPTTKLWALLCDLRYQMLLLDVLLALSSSRRTTGDVRRALTEWAVVHEMEFLKRIGQLLPRLPQRPRDNTATAGAPFETIEVPQDEAKRWDLQRVLLLGADTVITRLQKKLPARDPNRLLLNAIQAFDQQRLPTVIAHSRVPHRYDWDAGVVRRVRR
jgi:hypothetical protein